MESLKRNWLVFSFLIGIAGIVALVLNEYVQWQSANCLLALIGFLLTLGKEPAPTNKNIVMYVALFCSLLTFWLPQNTILFFALVFACIEIVNWYLTATCSASVLTLLMVSPFFQFFANLFTFPIRMQLCAWAGKILSIAEIAYAVHGKVISVNGNEFTVDPECMGLNMMVTSMLLGVILFSVVTKKQPVKYSLLLQAMLLLLIFGLNIFSNLFRMILLVHFWVLPNNPAHEAIGIVCFLLYVVLPALLVCKLFIKRWLKKTVDLKEFVIVSNVSRCCISIQQNGC